MTGVKAPTCVCVTGWHFDAELYRQLASLPQVDVFAVVHRPSSRVPAWLTEYVAEPRVLVRPNYGYDWGCYQQFLDHGAWRGYEYVVFIHDDVTIKSLGFLATCRQLLEEHAVVGNGRGGAPRAWADTHPESFLHASWRPARGFVHDAVRGSFFMTTARALERLASFEVFWDRLGSTSYYGNWSTRASCAKWEHRMGPRCFGFLSDTPCTSPYIDEWVRGGAAAPVEPRPVVKRLAADAIFRTSRWYMNRYGFEGNPAPGAFARMACRWVRWASNLPGASQGRGPGSAQAGVAP